MFITKDDISFAISILAFILSIYSVFKTNRFERFELIMQNPEYKKYGKTTRITFDIFNSGMRPIYIRTLNFKHPSNNDLIIPMHFDLDEYYQELKLEEYRSLSPIEQASFSWMPHIVLNNEIPSKTSDILINTNDFVSLTYYLDEAPHPINLVVTSNEKLTAISRTKTYSLIPTYSEENN